MIISAEFIRSLNLPSDAFHSDVYRGRPVYTILDPRYKQLFWTELWHGILADQFQRQKFVRSVPGVDFAHSVIIDEKTGELVSAPKTVEQINYYATHRTNELPFFILRNINSHHLVLAYLAIFLVSLCLWALLKLPLALG